MKTVYEIWECLLSNKHSINIFRIKINKVEFLHMQFYADEPFSWNSDQNITKIQSVHFKMIHQTCLYLEWLQSYAILIAYAPFHTTAIVYLQLILLILQNKLHYMSGAAQKHVFIIMEEMVTEG